MDLLQPVTLTSLLRNLRIPNLASAFVRAPVERMVPVAQPQDAEPIWQSE